MIFPELGPQYFDEKHKAILSRMEAFYSESITINQSFWGEADADTRFESGDQAIWTDFYGNLPASRRRQFNFNRIRRIVNMIGGHQRKNRKSIIAVPIENGDSETSDQFTKTLMWIQQQDDYLETFSQAFHGALVTGMNLLQVWVDYRSDPISGNIRVDNCSYNQFLIDPYFTKPDLSDCSAVWKRSFLSKRDCVSLLPDHAEEIAGLWGNESGTGRDGKFQFTPQSYGYAYKNLLTYDEFYYRDYRMQKMLVDTQTGETMEWRNSDEDRLKLFLQTYPTVTVIDQEVPTVRLAIVVQGKCFYDGPLPTGSDHYPFVPVYAYYNPQMSYWPQRIQGVVRNLRDAQYLYNRRKIIELDILESQITSGWKYKEGSLVNPDDVFNLSGQGKGLALKEEAAMTDVEQIMPPQVPPSMLQISESLGAEISQISGVNEELLGSATDDKAGVLSMLRQGAGLTTLQILFDQADQSLKLLGKRMIELIQLNFTPGKMKKILENKEPSDQFYSKNFGRYNCAVEEGLNTTTQRQMQFAQMLQLREAGVPIPDESLLEAATLTNKKELIDKMTAMKQQQSQAQQMQMQAQMQELQSRVQLSQAKATADEGLGLERLSRVRENEALAIERKAAAEKDKALELLNVVKALKEIESVDIAQLEKLIALAKLTQEENGKLTQEAPHINQSIIPTP